MTDLIKLPSGFVLDMDTLDLSELTIRDLAHNLSVLLRFNGAGMSVAHHSVLVLRRVRQLLDEDAGWWCTGMELDRPTVERWALLHDTPKGLGLGGMVSPIKQLPRLEGYRTEERRWMVAVCDRFALPRHRPRVVGAADAQVGKTEQLEIFDTVPPDKWAAVKPLDTALPWVTPQEAQVAFEIEAEGLGL